MSTLKTNNIQIGSDVDPNKNFTIKVPSVPNGTLEIRRGNADSPGALLTAINVDGGVNTGGPVFSMYQSTSQSLGAGANTKILFQSPEFNVTNTFDVATSRFNPKVAGYYQVNAAVRAVVNGEFNVMLWKNGSDYKIGNDIATNYNVANTISSLVYLNGTTDYLEIYAYSSVAATTGQGSSTTWVNGFLARAA